MKVEGNKPLLSMYIVGLLALVFSACDSTPETTVKSIGIGEKWVVAKTTSMSELTIAKGAVITAPEGYSLTMTVDGVETGIAPGTYTGMVVLTPTENIVLEYNDMGVNDTYHYRTALYINDGVVEPEKSVQSAITYGEVTDLSATDISITSTGDEFNGIIITGDSTYSIQNPSIDFTGNGGNDFVGLGAALMTDGNAEVTIKNAHIITRGVVRTAVFVGGHSTARIFDSNIKVYDGTFPDSYDGGRYKNGSGVMIEVPWMLGITGNCRATNLVGNGTVYYNNTKITAQAWGALSTDAVKDAKLYANNCIIEAIDSGYGAYADGNSIDTFRGCEINVPDYGLIMTQGSAVFTDSTVVNSGRFGVMSHSSRGGNTLTIEKGSIFNTKKAVIQIKASTPALNPKIFVDNAELNSENGIILQAFSTDNPKHRASGSASGSNISGTPPAGGAPGTPPSGGMPSGGPSGGMRSGGASNTDLVAVFSNMTLNGDIVNGNTGASDMIVTIDNATVTGAITTASTEYPRNADGEELTMEDWDLYHLMGEVTHTYGAMPEDPHGLSLHLVGTSTWIVDKTSYLTSLTVAEGTAINAPEGHMVTLKVDGVEVEIKVGSYEGNIVLMVN